MIRVVPVFASVRVRSCHDNGTPIVESFEYEYEEVSADVSEDDFKEMSKKAWALMPIPRGLSRPS